MTELNLKWRYATKKFDASRKLSDDQVHQLVESIRLSPTSYGLQPIHIKVISLATLKSELKEASFNQSQVTDCSHLFVFCIENDTNESHVDDYLNRISEVRDVPADALSGYGGVIKGFLGQKTTGVRDIWAARQTYLTLGFLLHTCAILKIDACPLEGFVPDKYDDILGLKAQGLSSIVAAAVGYRSTEDQTQHHTKVRKSTQEMFEFI